MSELGKAPVRPTDILALDSDNRRIEIQPVIENDEMINAALEDRMPMFKGIAIHQHCDLPRFSENGMDIEPRCDYIVLDINQVMHLKSLLVGIKLVTKDGIPIDDE